MTSDDLIDLLRSSAPERDAGARLHVAFSGGLDSTVLLHALASAGVTDLVAVHVHHGLQDIADDWVAHCESVCAPLGVPLRVQRVQVRDDRSGLEAAARDARYAALLRELRPGEVLATAHHLGDQAETLLLNLVRGTGPAGLGAMAALREFGCGRLWRPLLHLSRDVVQSYAQHHRLHWIEDPHNRDSRFARSFLREEVVPPLTQRWPAFEANLARAATLASESAALLRQLAEADIAAMGNADDRSLPVTGLRALSDSRRRNLVRTWVHSLGLVVPGYETLLHLDREVLCAAPDATPVLAWRGGEFRRHGDRLFAMPVLPAVPRDFCGLWDGVSPFALPQGCGVLEVHENPDVRTCDAPQWTVRMARPADRFRPHSRSRMRTLKNLFQEGGVPTWVRERTPLLVADEQLVWVGGFGWSAECASRTAPAHESIQWRHRPPGAPASN